MRQQNVVIDFASLQSFAIIFPLRVVYLNAQEDVADCFDVNVSIMYDNSLHDGRMTIDLSCSNRQRKCRGVMTEGQMQQKYDETLALNITVLTICGISLLFSARSLFRQDQMRRETIRYFKKSLKRKLDSSEQFLFFDLWLLLTISNDAITISGTALKLLLEKKMFESEYFSTCSVLLGLGGLLAWISVLRYLSFFPMYNVLFLTVKRSIPYLMRYSLCAFLLFGGFCICGWLVLSPYHVKFRTFSMTCESLFALLNGDDMFMTFVGLNPRGDNLIRWFARLYTLAYVFLFAYVVLSLFIAILMEAFDTIQVFYTDGFPLSELEVRNVRRSVLLLLSSNSNPFFLSRVAIRV